MKIYRDSIERYSKRTGFTSVFPEAALIDMDGTLYDSMPHHAKAWKLLTDELGFDIPENEFFSYEGMTGVATLEMLFRNAGRLVPSNEELKKFYRRKTEFFIRDGRSDIMPGAGEMIMTLAENGIARILVTGSGQMSLISKVCRDFNNLFSADAMVTSHDVVKGKPDPEPYLKGMAIAGKSPDRCIVIENAPLGIMAGRDSKAFTIGVCTGPVPLGQMLDAGPDILFGSMPEFADALPGLIEAFRDRHD